MAKYTVSITQARPPYAPEAVLVVEADNEDGAKRKAYEWLLGGYVFFAEEGAAKEEDFVEDVPFHDLASGDHII